MKKLIGILLILFVLLSGCSENLYVGGRVYPPYGLANKELKDNDVIYQVNKLNVIPLVLLSETIIVPFYIVLFDLYEPIGLKDEMAKD